MVMDKKESVDSIFQYFYILKNYFYNFNFKNYKTSEKYYIHNHTPPLPRMLNYLVHCLIKQSSISTGEAVVLP